MWRKKTDNKKTADLFQTLPIELRQLVFGFFKQPNDLCEAAKVSKEFRQHACARLKQIRDECKEQYKENVFYTYGATIPIGKQMEGGDDINDAIYDSFLCHKTKCVNLFATEEEAINFVDSNVDDMDLLHKAAIFKVLYMGDINELDMRRDHYKESEKDYELGEFCRQTSHFYAETEREKVIPLEGQFTLCLTRDSNEVILGQGDYSHLDIISSRLDYDHLDVILKQGEEEIQAKSRCLLM